MSGSTAPSPRNQLITQIQLRLGYGIIDLELDPEHYNFAVDVALQRYRQKSGNAVEESFLFLDMQPETTVYTLPQEVQEVRAIYRRTLGGTSGGAAIDPFSLAFTNNIYMIQNPGAMGTSGSGMLATYDLAMGFQSLVGRMFGRDFLFTWDTVTKRLTLERKVTAVEQIMLHVLNERPETVILADVYAKPWVRDYGTAVCKQMIGEARSLFGNIAGPQGGITLNGEAMKTEAAADIERLDIELDKFLEQHAGWPFVIG